MKKKKIAIALQGGGAHGAFSWGVIEKLLEEDVLDMRGFCGTSVGAINSALTVHGFQKNGNEGAIEMLERFWKEVSLASAFIMPQASWVDNHVFNGNMDFSPAYQLFNFWKNYLSPYQFNPFNINPLRDILSKIIDFDELAESDVKLFFSATNIRKGSCKVFSLSEIDLNALLASSCLPHLAQAVQVEGEYFWDGGYTGNPPMYPLIYGTDAKDVLLIGINPILSDKVPKNISDISDRINEITFNESLKMEMRMITRGYDVGGKFNDIFFHLISNDELMDKLDFSSKLNTSWEFLDRLRNAGRASAETWIREELKFVGKKSSEKIQKVFGYVEEDWLHEMIDKPAKHLRERPIGKKVRSSFT